MLFSIVVGVLILAAIWIIREIKMMTPTIKGGDGTWMESPDKIQLFECPTCGFLAEVLSYMQVVQHPFVRDFVWFRCLHCGTMRVTKELFDEHVST